MSGRFSPLPLHDFLLPLKHLECPFTAPLPLTEFLPAPLHYPLRSHAVVVTTSCIPRSCHLRAVAVSAPSTCGRRATAGTTTTATVTATRPACGPFRSTRPPTTARRPATTRAARRRSPPRSATARAATRTPEWSVLDLQIVGSDHDVVDQTKNFLSRLAVRNVYIYY